MDSSPNSKGSAIRERVRDVFDFVFGAIVEDIEREGEEVDRRRQCLDNKLNRFNAILRRFENDVRMWLVDDFDKAQRPIRNEGLKKYGGSVSPPTDSDLSMENTSMVPNERQIFVGGLPPSVSMEDLKGLFSGYGQVVGVKLLPKIPGKSACAFVAFESSQVVRDVLQESPRFVLPCGRSRHLYVEAKCSTAMMDLPDNSKVYVRNLPRGTRLIEVKEFFERYGPVVGAKMRPFRGRGRGRSLYAYVAFDSAETAQRVASIGTTYFGSDQRQIYVKLAGPSTSTNHGEYRRSTSYRR